MGITVLVIFGLALLLLHRRRRRRQSNNQSDSFSKAKLPDNPVSLPKEEITELDGYGHNEIDPGGGRDNGYRNADFT